MNWPEEHSHSGSTGGSVGRARPHVLPVQLTEAAGTLRAKHGAADQAQRRVLPLVHRGLRTPEGPEPAGERSRTETKRTETTGFLTESGWLCSGERCNPLEDRSTDSFSSDIWGTSKITNLFQDVFSRRSHLRPFWIKFNTNFSTETYKLSLTNWQ